MWGEFVNHKRSLTHCPSSASRCSSLHMHADGRGFEPHPRQPIFLWKMTFRRAVLCFLAFLLCYCCCLAFLSISLEVIVHAQYLVWGLVSSWFHYHGLLLNTKFGVHLFIRLRYLFAGFSPTSWAASVTQLVRALPGKLMVVSSSPT